MTLYENSDIFYLRGAGYKDEKMTENPFLRRKGTSRMVMLWEGTLEIFPKGFAVKGRVFCCIFSWKPRYLIWEEDEVARHDVVYEKISGGTNTASGELL